LSQTRYALPQFIKRPYAYAHRKKTSDGSHYEKRGNGEPICIDDEIPFEIPESWAWVRMESVLTFVNGRAYKKPELLSEGKYPVLRVGNLFTNSAWYYSNLELPEEKYCHRGDLLYAWSASFGPTIWQGGTCIFHYHIWNVLHSGQLDREYLYWFLLEDVNRVKRFTTGSTMIHVSMEHMMPRLLAIPPVNEQKKIVAKLKEILPHVADYGALEEARERLDAELPNRLHKSILQLAVQGKLVPQDPADEPASALLDRIRAERAALVKAKKIRAPKGGESVIYRASDGGYYEKRGKGVPVCIDNEIPFEIPESWEWVRLGSILELVSDGTHKTPEYKESGVLFLSVQNISKGYFDLSKVKYISRETHDELCKRVKPQNRDILLCRIGTLGKPIIVDVDYEFSIFVSLGLLRLIDSRLAEWVVDCIDAPIGFQWIQRVKVGGGTHTFKINLGDIPEFLIPLPPLNEQRRILNRCKALFSSAG